MLWQQEPPRQNALAFALAANAMEGAGARRVSLVLLDIAQHASANEVSNAGVAWWMMSFGEFFCWWMMSFGDFFVFGENVPGSICAQAFSASLTRSQNLSANEYNYHYVRRGERSDSLNWRGRGVGPLWATAEKEKGGRQS